ncbi:hypothetical protein PIB30_108049, partial [Stylosanthes scabra]|nr:hypothetical protein [Stylosanthes scabra]
MGQSHSCTNQHHNIHEKTSAAALFGAVADGELEIVEAMLKDHPSLLLHTNGRARFSPLHVAAANGSIQVLSMLLERDVKVEVLNRYEQTPLMLAAMNGKTGCVEKLIQAGAN